MVGSLAHLICKLNAAAFLAKSSKPLTIICLKDPGFFQNVITVEYGGICHYQENSLTKW